MSDDHTGPDHPEDRERGWADEPDRSEDWPEPEPEPGPEPRSEPGATPPPVGYVDPVATSRGEWVEHREPMSRRKRLLVAGAMVLAVVVLVAGLAYGWVQRRIDPPGPPGEEIELEVARGSTTEDIGTLLADNGVISSATVWRYWTRVKGEGPFQAGVYVFRQNSSFDDVVEVLEAGPRPPDTERVTIPEGLTVREIIDRLADPELGVDRWETTELRAVLGAGEIRSRYQPPDQASMEGLLFPDTYEVDAETDERAFVRRLVTELDNALTELDVETRAPALNRTPYEILIIASLIEEEARVPEDRAKISRVIHNRLVQGIPLGIDATSRYEAERAGRGRDDIDFDSDSPYNTRRNQGLPPTPIASPGRASLRAALEPEPGPWTYYVLADAEGHHFFTDSAQEFQRAKQECIEKDLGCG